MSRELLAKVRKWGNNIASYTLPWKLKRMIQDYNELYAGAREIGYNGEDNITKVKDFIRVEARKEGMILSNFSYNQYLKNIVFLWKLINKWEISFQDVGKFQIVTARLKFIKHGMESQSREKPHHVLQRIWRSVLHEAV